MGETVGTGIAQSDTSQTLWLFKFSSSARIHTTRDTPHDKEGVAFGRSILHTRVVHMYRQTDTHVHTCAGVH